MRIPAAPHRWTVSPREAVRIQRRLAPRIRGSGLRAGARWVAGVDAAYSRDGKRCIAAAVLWDARARAVAEQHVAVRALTFPYVPGLLSFREAPAVIAALRKLGRRPQLVLCDGHGRAHPRRFGIACHVGLIANLPAVGCGKSRLVGSHREVGRRRGASVSLVDRGEIVGRVLRTQDGVKPIFVSAGHRVSLAVAARTVLACAPRHRLPEPVRLADRLVAAAKREGR